MTATPCDAPWHLDTELANFLDLLAGYLCRQRERGRTPAADSVRGDVIEDGEAEGLVTELAESLAHPRPPTPRSELSPRDGQSEVSSRAGLGAPAGVFLPLHHAVRAFDLGAGEYIALLAALAVESDARFGRLVAYLNDHV